MSIQDIEKLEGALLTTKEAADFLGVTPRFLENRRCIGGGPQYVRISRRVVRYRRADLDRWIQEKIKSSTWEA